MYMELTESPICDPSTEIGPMRITGALAEVERDIKTYTPLSGSRAKEGEPKTLKLSER